MIGLVPKLQTLVVNSFNWSDGMKGFLMGKAGPFTSILNKFNLRFFYFENKNSIQLIHNIIS